MNTNSGEDFKLETQERRSNEDIKQLCGLLVDLHGKLDAHIREEATLKPQLVELIGLLERSKGALVLVKWLSATAIALAGFYAWASQHLTWKG